MVHSCICYYPLRSFWIGVFFSTVVASCHRWEENTLLCQQIEALTSEITENNQAATPQAAILAVNIRTGGCPSSDTSALCLHLLLSTSSHRRICSLVTSPFLLSFSQYLLVTSAWPPANLTTPTFHSSPVEQLCRAEPCPPQCKILIAFPSTLSLSVGPPAHLRQHLSYVIG